MQERLMVFSDDFLHFLKIKKKNGWIHQKYLVALIGINLLTIVPEIFKAEV